MTDASDSRPQLPYGSWPSPITTELITTSPPGVKEPGTDGARLLWIESRPQEQGRGVLIASEDGVERDITPAPFNVRNRVHEYGGGAWAARDGVIVFSHFGDNRLYRIDDRQPQPTAITPDGPWRFADLRFDPIGTRLYAVREDHSTAEVVNTLVVLDAAGPNDDGGRVFFEGSDFVSSPRLSADGQSLAWLSWDHPNMPWDTTSLWRGQIGDDGTLHSVEQVVATEGESVILPGWDREGRLLFVSDRTGWWHLYRREVDGSDTALTSGEREFGNPLWVFGMSTWCELADGTLVVSWTEEGLWFLGTIDPESGRLTEIPETFTSLASITPHPDGESVLVIAGSATTPSQLLRIDPQTGSTAPVSTLDHPSVPAGYISVAQPKSWPTPDGATAHGLYYPPTNSDVTAPSDALPPLIVESHGGPTGASTGTFDLDIQFWTSRGFAVLDVNYGGSTGYGRAYRERLQDAWGVVDVDDCASGARALVDDGLVDGSKLIIRGGSAGGYTTLSALAFRDVFTAGSSHYGIGDLEAMAKDTHKFESRYLDGLVGPYPEAIETYHARSAIHHVDRLSAPMILFQGLDDKVVPPNQSASMAEAVRTKGLPVALLEFEGEGHGFRKAESIAAVLDAELSFFAQVFGFTPADDIPTLAIDNLPVS